MKNITYKAIFLKSHLNPHIFIYCRRLKSDSPKKDLAAFADKSGFPLIPVPLRPKDFLEIRYVTK